MGKSISAEQRTSIAPAPTGFSAMRESLLGRNEKPGIKGNSRSGEAYLEIRRRILDNEWTPGFSALEQDLAEQLQMSRTPVREALLRLQDEGLVAVVPRHGMRVLPVSPEDMREIYQVLTALESAAAGMAAMANASEGHLASLKQACDEMEAALLTKDLQAWAEADECFHTQLLLLSGNKILTETVLRFWDRAHRARLVTLRLRQLPEVSTREHRELIDAISSGDSDLAERLHRSHRERGMRELLHILEVFQLGQV